MPDATGSILVGLLLGAVAVVLINRNLRFLVGEEADPRIRSAILRALLAMPEVARVTYLRLEVIGPRMVFVTGDVDLTGDDTESPWQSGCGPWRRSSAHRPRWGRRAEPVRPRRAVDPGIGRDFLVCSPRGGPRLRDVGRRLGPLRSEVGQVGAYPHRETGSRFSRNALTPSATSGALPRT